MSGGLHGEIHVVVARVRAADVDEHLRIENSRFAAASQGFDDARERRVDVGCERSAIARRLVPARDRRLPASKQWLSSTYGHSTKMYSAPAYGGEPQKSESENAQKMPQRQSSVPIAYPVSVFPGWRAGNDSRVARIASSTSRTKLASSGVIRPSRGRLSSWSAPSTDCVGNSSRTVRVVAARRAAETSD